MRRRARTDAGNLDAPRRQVDDEQDGEPRQACCRPHLNREEIRGRENSPVGLQKFLPGRPFLALRGWFKAVWLEDVGDRAAGDLVMQVASAPWIRV